MCVHHKASSSCRHSFQFGNSSINRPRLAAPIKFPLGFLGTCLKKKISINRHVGTCWNSSMKHTKKILILQQDLCFSAFNWIGLLTCFFVFLNWNRTSRTRRSRTNRPNPPKKVCDPFKWQKPKYKETDHESQEKNNYPHRHFA